MNRRFFYVFAATLVMIALVIVLWRAQERQNKEKVGSLHNETASQQQASTLGSSPAPSGAVQSGSTQFNEEHKEEVRTGMKALFEGLKQKGILREVPPIATQLQNAIESKDITALRRAFQDAIYSPSASMSEAITAVKSYLKVADPYVRYLAAEALLRVGDQSGVDALLKLIQSNESIPQGEQDLRLSSAHLLGRYGVKSAEGAIFDLYKRTSGSGLLSSLSQLQSANALNVFQKNGYYENKHSIERYGIAGADAFTQQISATFKQSSDLETKNAAAWSLARMTGGDQYLNHLIETARPAIEAQSNNGDFNQSTEALRYLGSIQSPQAVTVLEQALDSQNPVAVQYATVNLLFNQPGGSQKAEQLVIRELETSPRMLGTDLAMQIASKSDNPQIRSAAQSFATRTGSDRWRYWGVERADWPVQNWIYDYAVTVNP